MAVIAEHQNTSKAAEHRRKGIIVLILNVGVGRYGVIWCRQIYYLVVKIRDSEAEQLLVGNWDIIYQ